MKKLVLLLFVLIPIISFSQVKGEFVGFEELIYHYDATGNDSLIYEDEDSLGQFRIVNVANPVDDLDAVNKRALDSVRGELSQPFDSINFTQQATKEHSAGMMYFDSVKNNFVFFNNNANVALDGGKEGWIDVYNPTSDTIKNGSCVVFSGNGGSHPSIKLARADLPVNMSSRLGVATHDIPPMTYGLITIWGLVHDFNTSGMSTGQKLFMSPFTFGALTTTKARFPNTSILIATVDSVGINGSINVDIIGDPSKVLGNINNGCFIESFTFSVSSDGTTIKGDLVNKSGDDWLIMKFSDGLDTIDLTSAREITLIAGTDANPQKQYVYIDESTRDLAVSTSYWSSTEHIPIAEIVVQSALTVQTVGAIRNQNINNHVADDTGMGGLDHMRKRIRTLFCVWEDGVAPSVTGNNVTTTGGNAWQMHLQPYDAWDLSTDFAFIPNSPIQNYRIIDALNDITTDASGGTLKNNEYSIVLIGIQNSGNDPDQMFINVPTGTYNNLSDAILDEEKYSVYNIPSDYRGVGFLIARLTFSNANNVWTLEDTEDLRGTVPNNIAGGGGTSGGGYTTFLELDDTPSAFTGSENKLVSVSSAANALEFSTYKTIDLDTIGINAANISTLDNTTVKTVNSIAPTAGNVDVGLSNLNDYSTTNSISVGGLNSSGNGSFSSAYGTVTIIGTGGRSRIHLGDNDDVDVGKIEYNHINNSMAFTNDATESMRLTSNQNLLVGTSTESTTDKLQIDGNVKANTAKLTNLTDTYFPIHTSDALGFEDSKMRYSGGDVILENTEAFTGFTASNAGGSISMFKGGAVTGLTTNTTGLFTISALDASSFSLSAPSATSFVIADIIRINQTTEEVSFSGDCDVAASSTYRIDGTEIDVSPTNELQVLSLSNDTIYLSDGDYVVLPDSETPLMTTSILGGAKTGTLSNTGLELDASDSVLRVNITDLVLQGFDPVNDEIMFYDKSPGDFNKMTFENLFAKLDFETPTYTSTTVNVELEYGTGDFTLNEATTTLAGLQSAANRNTVLINAAKVSNATHTGEVTGSTALTITDNVVDEANLKASNTPTDNYLLSYNASTGGFTWVTAGGNGTVTSVAISSTDFSVSGSPITTSGTFTLNLNANSVQAGDLNDNVISGLTDIGAAIVGTDEMMISDAGTLKRTDVSRVLTYIEDNFSGVTSLTVGTGMDQTATTGAVATSLDFSEFTSDNIFASTDEIVYLSGSTHKRGTVMWYSDTYGIRNTSGNTGIGAASKTNAKLFVSTTGSSNAAADFFNSSGNGILVQTDAAGLYYNINCINGKGINIDSGSAYYYNQNEGITTTFIDNDGNTITVSGGIITAKTAP